MTDRGADGGGDTASRAEARRAEAARPRAPCADAPSAEGHVLGNPGAAVTVLEYGDYECPYCAAAAPVLRDLVSSSGGRVRLVFRNFPLFEVHPHALTAALAAESTAAGGEPVFWQMHDHALRAAGAAQRPGRSAYAEAVGADPDLAVGEPAQGFARQVVQADYAAGLEAGVSATPTLFIDGGPYSGRVDLGRCDVPPGCPAADAAKPGAVHGGGGRADGAASPAGEHSDKRSPMTRSRSTPRAAPRCSDPAEDPDLRLLAQGSGRGRPGR